MVILINSRQQMGIVNHNNELKSHIAIDAICSQKTRAALASDYGVHGNQISIWNKPAT